jgi:hypothetical protein
VRPDARALVAEARKAAPEGLRGYDVEAMLFDREGKREEARAAFTKAVGLNSESFYTHYRLGLLSCRPDPDQETRATIEKLVRRSLALNDTYPLSHALLADVMVLGPQPGDGLGPALKAISLDPGSSSVRLSLARVLWRLARRDDAKAETLAARALARSDAERSQAEELFAFFNRAAVQ